MNFLSEIKSNTTYLPIKASCISIALSLGPICNTAIAQQTVPFVAEPISVDGKLNEQAWSHLSWLPMNHHIVGEIPSKEDFSGSYKLLWDENYLYLAAKITDDVLYDRFANPLEKYWDDDCLEVFIDEDNSGGNHQFNFNAFAYHIALDNQAVDIGFEDAPGGPFILLNEHINSVWKRHSNAPQDIIWEVAIEIHDQSFEPNKQTNSRVKLKSGKQMGFMLAYCDNDGSEQREHFMGSHKINPVNDDKNLGYITADVFGEIILGRKLKNNTN